jgi:hypothetical protein
MVPGACVSRQVTRLNNRRPVPCQNWIMNDDKPKNVAVVLTEDLSARSLAAAHDAGMSRSELIRRLLIGHLAQNGES